MEKEYLDFRSTLFWLILLPAIGIIFIGLRFILAPATGAEGFGVPINDPKSFPYLYVKGTRDIVSGLLVLAFLWQKLRRIHIAILFFITALILSADFLNVIFNSSDRAAPWIHGLTALYMIVVAIVTYGSALGDRGQGLIRN